MNAGTDKLPPLAPRSVAAHSWRRSSARSRVPDQCPPPIPPWPLSDGEVHHDSEGLADRAALVSAAGWLCGWRPLLELVA